MKYEKTGILNNFVAEVLVTRGVVVNEDAVTDLDFVAEVLVRQEVVMRDVAVAYLALHPAAPAH